MDLKFIIIIAMLLFIFKSAILMAYMNYSLAKSGEFKFTSETKSDVGYYTMASSDARDKGVSAPMFWKSRKYFLIAGPVMNAVAGLLGVYLLVFNK